MAKKTKTGGGFRFNAQTLTLPGLYLVVFAICGWLILIANLFGIAGKAGWIFPRVEDIPGLAASTVLCLLLGMTPLAIRQALGRGKDGRT